MLLPSRVAGRTLAFRGPDLARRPEVARPWHRPCDALVLANAQLLICSNRALLRLERTTNLLEGGKGGEGRVGERGRGGERRGGEGGEGRGGRDDCYTYSHRYVQ